MENFKKGETVIALSDNLNIIGSQPRKKGKQYPVLDIEYCAKCGRQSINICGKFPKYIIAIDSKCGCGHSQANNGLYWTNSKHFIRPSELKQKIAEAVEQENYEEAAELRDLILNK